MGARRSVPPQRVGFRHRVHDRATLWLIDRDLPIYVSPVVDYYLRELFQSKENRNGTPNHRSYSNPSLSCSDEHAGVRSTRSPLSRTVSRLGVRRLAADFARRKADCLYEALARQ